MDGAGTGMYVVPPFDLQRKNVYAFINHARERFIEAANFCQTLPFALDDAHESWDVNQVRMRIFHLTKELQQTLENVVSEITVMNNDARERRAFFDPREYVNAIHHRFPDGQAKMAQLYRLISEFENNRMNFEDMRSSARKVVEHHCDLLEGFDLFLAHKNRFKSS